MALVEQSTLRREQENCVKTSLVNSALRGALRWLKPLRHPHIRQLDAHLARDIGLSPGDTARHQHRWPSETTQHPRW